MNKLRSMNFDSQISVSGDSAAPLFGSETPNLNNTQKS
jgi:hypothetical protein